MKKPTKLTYNYFFNLANQILISLLPLITTPYVSRVLGVENIGHYSFAQSIASYFSMAAVLGTSLYGQRKIAQYREDIKKRTKLFWEILSLRTLLTVIVFALYAGIIIAQTSEKILYLAVSLDIVGTCFDVSWFFQGLEEFQPITLCNAVAKLLATAGIFIFVKDADDTILYALLHSGSLVLGYLFLWKMVPKKLEPQISETLQPLIHIRPSVLLFISQAAMQVYTVLDKTMLGVLTGSDVQNGLYEQGQKLIRMLTALVTAVGVVMASRVANLWSRHEKEEIQLLMERSFRLTYLVAFPVMYGVILIAPRFVPIFYGTGYDGVTTLLYILALLFPIVASSNVIGIQYLVPTGQEHALTLSVVAGAVINFGFNLFLIPHFLAKGAAVGSVIAEVFVTGIQFWIVRKQLQTRKFIRIAIHYGLLGLPMFAVGVLMNRFLPMNFWGMVVLIMGSVLVYAATLLVTKDAFMKDLLKGKIL